jgi:hypothetical protein
MRLYRIILLCFLSVPGWAQIDKDLSALSKEEHLLLTSIAAYEVVRGDTTGKLLRLWPERESFLALSKKMSAAKLLELTRHEKPIIRCRAFDALIDEYQGDALSLVQEHLQDTASVYKSARSCLDMKGKVGDYFVEVYQWKCLLAKDSLRSNKLDSVLIYQPNKLHARYMAMHRAANAGKYYERIREIVLEGDFREGGLMVLAKFKREQDIDVILNWDIVSTPQKEKSIFCTFYAIAKFPHPAFSPFLQQNIKKAIVAKPTTSCRGLYLAIANYNNRASHDLLLLPFQIADKSMRTEHLQTLASALKENSDPIYNDLRARLKGYK